MIYPNRNIEISQLLNMIRSPEYMVYFEPNDEPQDWDWKKNGIYHSPKKRLLTDKMQLLQALTDELLEKGCICYDITDIYNAHHPYTGEEVTYNDDKDYFWEYHSPNGRHYKICDCSYLGEKPKNIPLEIVLFDGDFNSACFQLGSWSRDDEGYEFHSCGSRIFDYIDDLDIPVVWKAIHKADIYLNERFKKEYEDV